MDIDTNKLSSEFQVSPQKVTVTRPLRGRYEAVTRPPNDSPGDQHCRKNRYEPVTSPLRAHYEPVTSPLRLEMQSKLLLSGRLAETFGRIGVQPSGCLFGFCRWRRRQHQILTRLGHVYISMCSLTKKICQH